MGAQGGRIEDREGGGGGGGAGGEGGGGGGGGRGAPLLEESPLQRTHEQAADVLPDLPANLTNRWLGKPGQYLPGVLLKPGVLRLEDAPRVAPRVKGISSMPSQLEVAPHSKISWHPLAPASFPRKRRRQDDFVFPDGNLWL